MSFTRTELNELKELSKATFGSTSFWQNKLLKKHPLYDFEQMKAHILQIQENTAKIMAEMKASQDTPKVPEALTLTV